MTTSTPTEDVHSYATMLRDALAQAPAGPATEKVRAAANAAREAHELTVPLLVSLINELVPRTTEASKLPTPRPNKYAQPCERCGKWVEIGEGVLERDDADTRWMVSHPEDPGCPIELLEGAPEGRYAIDWGLDGAERVEFYQIKERALYRQAGDDLLAIGNLDHVNKALAHIKADPKAASILYGLKLGKCGVCGRTLTNQESRDQGIGPICIKKMGW